MDVLYKNGWLPAVVTTLQLCLPFPAIAVETADEATLPTVTVKAAAKAKPAATKGYVAEYSSSAAKTKTEGYCYLGQARTVIGSLRYVW